MGVSKAFGSVWTRIGLGLAAVSSVVVLLWSDENWQLDAGALIAALTALVLWIWSEITSLERAVSPHDLELFENFRNAYGPEAKSLLRDHDFGNSFVFKKANGLFEMSYWDDATYEYVDPKVQEKWKSVRVKIDEFIALIAEHTGRVSGNASLATVHPDHGDPDFPEDFVVKRMDVLNAAANPLFASLEEFERSARKRLKL